MPAPGYAKTQAVVIEGLGVTGSIQFYERFYDLFTQVGLGPTGTVTGSVTGFILEAKALTQLAQVSVVGYSEWPWRGRTRMQVAGFGKGLGTLVGSVSGLTYVSDSNTVLIKAYQIGTVPTFEGFLPAEEIVAGLLTLGTVQLLELGT